MISETWELEWSSSGPGVRLRGSPLWFDAWPRSGVGFLSSLDAVARQRIRGQVLCPPEMVALLRVLRPRARALPLRGTIGLGRLRLTALATESTPAASCLLVERGSGGLLYVREGDESVARTLPRPEGRFPVDTLLWASREPPPVPAGVTAVRDVPEGDLPGIVRDLGERGESALLVLAGVGSALRVLGRLGGSGASIPILATPGVRRLCRARVVPEMPAIRPWDGIEAIPRGAVALWVGPVPRGRSWGPCDAQVLRVRFEDGDRDLLQAVRTLGLDRVILTGARAPVLHGLLAQEGIRAEVLGPLRVPTLW